jgi:nicotinate-nucleotide adenylyltransferase
MKKRIALYGGSFDPPHICHNLTAAIALSMGFDQVWFIPTMNHPFSKNLISFEHRLNMVKLATAQFGSTIIVNTIESETDDVSRTYDTVNTLLKRFPDCEFSLLIGEDNLKVFNKWYKNKELKELINIITIGRGDSSNLSIKLPDISSSLIRNLIKSQNHEYKQFLNPNVINYIDKHNLYPDENVKVNIGLYGFGKVGSSLCHSLINSGNSPLWIYDINESQNKFIPINTNIPFLKTPNDFLKYSKNTEVIIFSTPDSIKLDFPTEFFINPPICLHTGGMNSPSKIFPDLSKQIIGLIHPLISISMPNTNLEKKTWGFAGGDLAQNSVEKIVKILSGKHVKINIDKIHTYHAVAALLANSIGFISALSEQTYKNCFDFNDEEIKTIILQLISSSVEGLKRSWLPEGITGPLVRHDWECIQNHLDSLKNDSEELFDIYRILLLKFIEILGIKTPRFLLKYL